MTKRDEMILQDLMDWMGTQYEETGHIPTIEEMYLYLLKGYDVVYNDEMLEELRMTFIEE